MNLFTDRRLKSEENNIYVYQARKLSTNSPVILKTLKVSSLLNPEKLKNEYEILKKIKSNKIISTLGYLEDDFTLILEDFSPLTLKDTIGRENNLKNLLVLAIQIAEGVGDIHRAKIIHKSISPENILVSEDLKKIKIVNFEFASQLNQEVVAEDSEIPEKILPYISPEQTGRTNLPLDYRSDIYSLGVTLYYLFTKKLPFETKDPLDLIHSHIAKPPEAPDHVNKELPEMISRIILKCLSKSPENRYKSAYGVSSDLSRSLEGLLEGHIHPFELGEKDIVDHFQIPAKLFGRSEEIKKLLLTFEETLKGPSRVQLIKGYSGVGKSSLVESIKLPVQRSNGFLLSGKFEAFKKQIPYHGLIEAINGLIDQLSAFNEEKLAIYRNKIQDALKDNGQVLIDLVPDLKNIIHEQPEVLKLGLEETNNRLNYVLSSFLGCFLEEGVGFVIILDDIQWADEYSLRFFESFLLNEKYKNYLLILSYRDNEVGPTHPVTFMLERLKNKGASIESMQLLPLKIDSINELVNETYQFKSSAISELAKIVYYKTDGNPFFAKEFMRLLNDKGLVTFDSQRTKWVPDLSAIKEMEISVNVADILVQIISTLDLESIRLLKIGSAIGRVFDEHFLSHVAGVSTDFCSKHLIEALKKDLVSYSVSRKGQVIYTFNHDRIQQAFFNLMTEEEKGELNLRIARLALKYYPLKEREERINQIVDHYNQSIHLINDPDERMEVAQANLKAGLKAKSAGAFNAALENFRVGLSCLLEDSWKSNYDLTFSLKTENAILEQMVGDPKTAETLFDESILHAKTNQEKLQIYSQKMLLFMQKRRYREAFEIGYRGLDLTRFKLPKTEVSGLRIMYELLKTEIRFYKVKYKDLKNLPKAENLEIKYGLNIMSHLVFCSYMLGYNYLLFLTLIKMYQTTLNYGMSHSGITALALYANALCWIFAKQYEKGQKLMRAVLEIVHNDPKNIGSIEAEFFIYNIGYRWIEKFSNCSKPLEEVSRKLMEFGNLPFASVSSYQASIMKLLSGAPLNEVEAYTIKIIPDISRAGVFDYLAATYFLEGFTKSLQGKTKERDVFYSEEVPQEFVRDIEKDKITEVYQFNYKVFLVWMNVLTGNYHKAIEQAQPVLVDVCLFANYAMWNTFYFYYTLAMIGDTIETKEKKWAKEIKKYKDYFKKWAEVSSNYQAAYHIISAEIHRMEGAREKSIILYQKAIRFAKDEFLIHEEALATERLSQVYMELKDEIQAKEFLQRALKAYSRWGAVRKVDQLKSDYSELLQEKKETLLNESVHRMSQEFDFKSLIEISRSISKEFSLPKLVETSMHNLLKIAGADKVVLLLEEADAYKIQAELTLEKGILKFYENKKSIGDEDLSRSAINYCIHTSKLILLNDAFESGPFMNDPYIEKYKVRSLAVIPLLEQSKLKGILYLENRLISGAFTLERIHILDFVSSQMTISISNAQFYSQLENKVHERTEELSQALNDLKEAQDKIITQEKLKEREIVKNKLGRYISNSQVLDLILNQKIDLEGTEKEVTVLFCDIRNFTALSEGKKPKETVSFLNEFFTDMVSIVIAHGGIVDKFIGDAMMVLFGPIESSPDDPTRAVEAAIAIQKKIKEKYTIKAGIGINTGRVLIGNIGSSERIEYTAIGDAVNTASRVESLTKELDVQILITESTKNLLTKKIPLTDRGEFTVRGKTNSIKLYEVNIDDPKQ